ncbi:ecto-ADP-ribosyltransferase 5-like [Rhinoderma darwinii]|uniref:ecto-ADP-ribosyltransferase 5-like n=1 Tax=Rhinoderma darwinii TaxID=43563 RepID=UPI003F6706D5
MRLLEGGYIFLCLMFRIRAQEGVFDLDMSSKAFDDQYEGCTDEMEEEVKTKLLSKEKLKNPTFALTWDNATRRWHELKLSVPRGFKDEYGIAIMAYTNNDSTVYKSFNAAVRDYESSFGYHSLHFFLTRGVRLLRSSCWWAPWKVYRGMNGAYFKKPTIEDKIRLGQFSSSSTNKKKAEEFGKDPFFTISSCFGVNVKRFSYKPDQEEILIPVDEMFQVTNFTMEGNGQRIDLKTTKKRCHYYNCEYLKRGGRSSSCIQSGGMRILSSPAVMSLLLSIVASYSL